MRSFRYGLALWFAAALAAIPVGAFEVGPTVSPAITAQPIEITIWLKPGVTPENLTRSLDAIQQGLDLWEAVPTSEIRFDIVEVVESADEPPKLPHQLRIILANGADLESGGASLPDEDGNPGTWFGAVADIPTLRLVEVTAHEIGHALGFFHSTVSILYPPEQRPIMHFAIGNTELTTDDIAMISSTYPNPVGPQLSEISATIRGRLIAADDGTPIDGVNLVAVDAVTGEPSVARISGADGSPGTFELIGLPPGAHVVHVLDGYSYRGSFLGFGLGRSNGNGFQADNFTPFALDALDAMAGDVIDVGDVAIELAPLSIERVHVGSGSVIGDALQLPAVGMDLPSTDRSPYQIWLHVVGGLRDLDGIVSGLPAGLTAAVRPNPRSPNVGIHGQSFVQIVGFPQEVGTFSVVADLSDLRGVPGSQSFNLEIVDACPPDDRDADGLVDCEDPCLDADADGYGDIGGAFGGACLGSDCDDDNATIFPDAPEVNDGLDNQCSGDLGRGLVDETSGESGFVTPGDTETYSWPAQAGATRYEVVRSESATFATACLRITTFATFFVDTQIPPQGGVFHYLNRPLSPNTGSWGRGSDGERDAVCP